MKWPEALKRNRSPKASQTIGNKGLRCDHSVPQHEVPSSRQHILMAYSGNHHKFAEQTLQQWSGGLYFARLRSRGIVAHTPGVASPRSS
eukprot:5817929-Amphidinium_carterae.1